MNPYAVLGLDVSASAGKIRRAYRELARRWHPDRFRDPDQRKAAEEKFREIVRAGKVLIDPKARAHYDRYGEIEGEPEIAVDAATANGIMDALMGKIQ